MRRPTTPPHSNNSVLTISALSELRIHLVRASIFFSQGQTQREYPKRRFLWTISVRTLCFPIRLNGAAPIMFSTINAVCRTRPKLVHHSVIRSMGSQYGMITHLESQNALANPFLRYYSDVDITHGFFTVSIDGSTPERLNGKNNGGQLTQKVLWSKTNLSPGRHTFTLTHDDVSGTFISLDFFR